ncbi:MAG: hypothetical protein ABIP97_01120 [Chthoniobacterales bacterium]
MKRLLQFFTIVLFLCNAWTTSVAQTGAVNNATSIRDVHITPMASARSKGIQENHFSAQTALGTLHENSNDEEARSGDLHLIGMTWGHIFTGFLIFLACVALIGLCAAKIFSFLRFGEQKFNPKQW